MFLMFIIWLLSLLFFWCLCSINKGAENMESITFNSLDFLTLEDCILFYENGIDCIVDEGNTITFQIN